MGLKLFSRKKPIEEKPPVLAKADPTPPEPFQAAPQVRLSNDTLERELQRERYGWVIAHRNRWLKHSQIEELYQQAVDAIDQNFAMVPEGFVSLTLSVTDYPGCPEQDVETEAFLLARHCVTNAQYQMFVDADGYADMDLWPRDIWPHLIDFKDQTDKTGPRYWRDGRHDRRQSDHPVVGICHYEAAAYARWAGYRLPSNAEWQMAASWRIRSSAHVLRRYPWGDAYDTSRCNLWSTAIGRSVPVNAYPGGAAPNGVLQLIGNVWEWVGSDYEVCDDAGREVVGDMLLKEIRGGAFDTYFAAQATSCFRTGLPSLARMHNVGFRCVLDLNDASGQA